VTSSLSLTVLANKNSLSVSYTEVFAIVAAKVNTFKEQGFIRQNKWLKPPSSDGLL
jgi:hypothetical protein